MRYKPFVHLRTPILVPEKIGRVPFVWQPSGLLDAGQAIITLPQVSTYLLNAGEGESLISPVK
jgi:hypothetical protein